MPRQSTSSHRSAHVFVDETKAKNYIMVATCMAQSEVKQARQMMRSLVPSGRFRMHFKKLSNQQRRRALDRFSSVEMTVMVARSTDSYEVQARVHTLTEILKQLRDEDVARIIIERDDSFESSDKSVARRIWPEGRVIHVSAKEEPLLWISDAVAWCLQRGGTWAQAVRPFIESDRTV